MLFTIDKEKIEHIPHRKDYDRWRSELSDENYLLIMQEMEKVLNEKEVFVSSFIPGREWDYPYEYIYEAAGKDVQNAAFFFGLLMWEAVQKHADNWSFQKYDESQKAIKGMVYFKIQL